MKKTNLLAMLMLIATAVSGQQLLVPSEYGTVQEAIEAASAGDSVIIAEGMYYENINFIGKAITVGSQYLLDDDTTHISKTIINGSQSANPDTASTVLMISGEDENSKLIGLTITGGTGTFFYDNQPEFGHDNRNMGGGGILIMDGGATIEHNYIVYNKITTPLDTNACGVGITVYISEDTRSDGMATVIRHNLIKGNLATGKPCIGAGIFYFIDKADAGVSYNLNIQNNIVTENKIYSPYADANNYSAGISVGMELPIRDGDYIIQDNMITKNVMEHPMGTLWAGGGGIYMYYLGATENDNIAPWIVNNVIAENVSPYRGGGISLYYFNGGAIRNLRPVIINNTIVNNTAQQGSGLHFTLATPLLLNNIVWNNTGSYEIHEQNSNNIIASYNNIRGGWDQGWNMDTEPLFLTDSYNLSENSPCVGHGVDSVEVAGTWYRAPKFDMLGNARKNIDRIDLGAIESSYAAISILDIEVEVQDDLDEDCDGYARVDVKAGFPPFSYYLDGVEGDDNVFPGLCEGTYEFKVVDADGSEVTETVYIQDVGLSPSVGDQEGFSIYPNPANNMLTIEVDQPGGDHFIQIHSVNGQLQYDTEFSGNGKQIDISGFSKGVYIITLKSNSSVMTRKLIKH